jgi:hypothetical protein
VEPRERVVDGKNSADHVAASCKSACALGDTECGKKLSSDALEARMVEGSEPGGFKAISRWLRRPAPTPPDHRPTPDRIP